MTSQKPTLDFIEVYGVKIHYMPFRSLEIKIKTIFECIILSDNFLKIKKKLKTECDTYVKMNIIHKLSEIFKYSEFNRNEIISMLKNHLIKITPTKKVQ